jgi:curli production assembly/transport component CsgE
MGLDMNMLGDTLCRCIHIHRHALALCGLALLTSLVSYSALSADGNSGKTTATQPAKAQNKPQPASRSAGDNDWIDSGVLEGNELIEGNLEISGLMSDETVTKFGHEFFDAFHRAWKPIEGTHYNIIIGERVDPIRGSLINLRLDQNVIYEGFLTPKLDELKELASALAKEVNNLVRSRQNLESEPEY